MASARPDHPQQRAFAGGLLLFALLACTHEFASPEVAATDNGAEQQVVGGQEDYRFPSVGLLAMRRSVDPTWLTGCGVTLIAPNYVVTAAHCIALSLPRGHDQFGAALEGQAINPAVEYHVHPSYDFNDPLRYRHDVAVLKLANPVTDREPASIGPAEIACGYRFVGYGRTVPGGDQVRAPSNLYRKSSVQCVSQKDSFSLFAQGVDGGLCWGDSGGPLLVDDPSSKTEVVGVLSDFNRVFSCFVGNDMIFTSLANERDFLCSVTDGALGSFCSESFNRDNLVLHAEVTASSSYHPDFGPHKMLDSDFGMSSKWVSAGDDPEPTVTFDFATPQSISEVVVFHANFGTEESYYATREFLIEGRGSEGWDVLFSVDNDAEQPRHRLALTTPRTLDALRLRVLVPGVDAHARILELRAHGPSEGVAPDPEPDEQTEPEEDPCSEYTTVEACDAHGDLCAFYYCALNTAKSPCQLRGTSVEEACP